MTLVMVLVGGAVGAPLRYLVDGWTQTRCGTAFPWGTLVVNVVGSAILGAVLAAGAAGALSAQLVALLGTGLCGALTTFSTFSHDTMRLAQQGRSSAATINVVVSVVAGLTVASATWALTTAVIGAHGRDCALVVPEAEAVVAVAATLLHIVSTSREPRRWRNGVLLLLVLWSVAHLVVGPLGRRLLAALGADPAYGSLVVLGLPWLASVLIGALLLLNGFRLLRPGGHSLGNIASLVLGLGVVAATAVGAALVASGSPPVSVAGLVVLLLPGYPALAFLSYLLYCLGHLLSRPRPAPAAIIVLGSGLVHGSVPRLLARRLDAGLAVRRREELSGRRPPLVPSGGQGDDEPMSEGAAMTAYLLERGLDEDDVLTEDRATTTEENLALSRELLAGQGITGHVRVVTSSYHVGRAALLSRRLSMDADVTGARTSWYFLPSAFLREFVAALSYHPWLNAAGLAGWVLATSVLTYAVIVD